MCRTLLIVHDKKTEKYANLLDRLINSKDDKEEKIVGIKDGAVETSVWSEEKYIDNKPTFSGTNYVLFIGNSKIITTEAFGLPKKLDKFGLNYSALGTKGCLKISRKIEKKEFQDFIVFSKKYMNIFSDSFDNELSKYDLIDNYNNAKGKAKSLKRMFLTNLISPFAMYAVLFKDMKDTSKAYEELAYSTLVFYFYYEELQKFLE